mmetsp:Transcript_4813/g.6251  ORF Transcript_4813/g.6251 Transcript_4813/m.6251 type:complete len:430 (+) Transcript_4813:152-1441(+)|eukprot:CAMPEP_0198140202 /NCGR_PEP_ID=MMETSP1443-20131203/3406_1 /TAXON_ID=186043 /ORGANISM="Entomoneis sp., Strain CCMP2396" /LENGTH=429 /DNA_ID=CAMNT_0043802561 /DNA_START=77 /DNA_END=1366 /DNA_ORIENTATION=-
MKALSENSYAIMVHKLYQKRVHDFLALGKSVEILDFGHIATGVSKDRRGYVILLLQTKAAKVASLSPMARQNISWISRMSHCVPLEQDDQRSPRKIGEFLFNSLMQHSFQLDKHFLRVEVHPRGQVELVCRSLQLAAGLKDDEQQDPFEGPIEMTKSRKRCKFKLTVVFEDDNADNAATASSKSMYWGIDRRPEDDSVIDLALNHEAKHQIKVVPCDCKTGKEMNLQTVNVKIPLSRAYYKLDQVYHDHLVSQKDTLKWEEGIGLDLGASPGGWSQVLVHLFGLSSVVAVDSAALADRIGNMPQVTHVQSTMENKDSFPKGPYSVVVCDASIVYMELFDLIQTKVIHKIRCCLPCIWVLTMKLPFRSLGSIQRHIRLLEEMLDQQLSDMTKVLYPNKEMDNLNVKAEIIHLMANSDSERTLMVTFREKE